MTTALSFTTIASGDTVSGPMRITHPGALALHIPRSLSNAVFIQGAPTLNPTSASAWGRMLHEVGSGNATPADKRFFDFEVQSRAVGDPMVVPIGPDADGLLAIRIETAVAVTETQTFAIMVRADA